MTYLRFRKINVKSPNRRKKIRPNSKKELNVMSMAKLRNFLDILHLFRGRPVFITKGVEGNMQSARNRVPRESEAIRKRKSVDKAKTCILREEATKAALKCEQDLKPSL